MNPKLVLIADDDADDRMMAEDAWSEIGADTDLRFVEDGVELMAYLRHQSGYEDAPRPGLILLDLNMPRKDGRAVLTEMQLDRALRRIPVIILTTSSSEVDIQLGYELGAVSYICKPTTYDGLVEVMAAVNSFTLESAGFPYSKKNIAADCEASGVEMLSLYADQRSPRTAATILD